MKKLIKRWLDITDIEEFNDAVDMDILRLFNRVNELESKDIEYKYELGQQVRHAKMFWLTGYIVGKIQGYKEYSVTDDLGYTHRLEENELIPIEDAD